MTAGHSAAAARYDPIAFPLAAGILVLLTRAAVGWTTGRWLAVHLSPTARRVLVVGIAAVIALEIRQQLHSDLLMQTGTPAP